MLDTSGGGHTLASADEETVCIPDLNEKLDLGVRYFAKLALEM